MCEMLTVPTILENIEASIIVLTAFIFMLAMYLVGFKLKRYLLKRQGLRADTGFGIVEGALLTLFAFFLGFTFSMANERFDRRRDTIVKEAIAISTAILRADLYTDSIRHQLRVHFQKYLEFRIDYFEAKRNKAKTNVALAGAASERLHLWTIATGCLRASEQIEANRQMIPAMNGMFDAAINREATREETGPESIIRVLLTLSVCSAFVVGFSLKERTVNYVIAFVFIVMVSATVYLILDLDRSRQGMITTAPTNQRIVDLRELLR